MNARLRDLIGRNRLALEQELISMDLRRFFSPIQYGLERAIKRCIKRHAAGRVLDAGCGYQPHRKCIEALASYDSIDVEKKSETQTLVGDIQNMADVGSETYDTVVCSEVLEHLPDPEHAIREFRRILKPSGTLILSVPFLSRLHEEPHDYYRYTRYGLRILLGRQDFEVIEVTVTGSMASFLGHQLSTIALGTTWHVAGLKWMILIVNAIFITVPCHLVDRLFEGEKAPAGYVVAARRL